VTKNQFDSNIRNTTSKKREKPDIVVFENKMKEKVVPYFQSLEEA
jgi:hypothetical protein